MLEGDRSRSSTSASARRAARRHAVQGHAHDGIADRRHRAQRRRHLPHGDDQLEPGDRAIIFTNRAAPPRSRRLCDDGGVTVVQRPGALGVDVGSVLNLVGAVLKYLGAAFLFPAAVALGYDEPVWPFLAAAAITASAGFLVERGTQGKERVGPREGCLASPSRRLAVPAFGALPYLFADEPQVARPVDAYFEAMSASRRPAPRSSSTSRRSIAALLMWRREFSQWLGGMGIIVLAVAVLPGFASEDARFFSPSSPARTRSSGSVPPSATARRLWVLYVALTLTAIVVFSAYGWTGADSAMSLYEAAAQASLDALDRWLLDPGGIGSGLRRRATSVDDRGLPPARRDQLPAPLSRARARARPRRGPRRRVPPLPRARRRRLGAPPRGAPRRRPGGRRGGRARGGLPSGLDHDDRRVREHRLHGLEPARRADAPHPHVPRRLRR